ncbi:MAG: oligosaccharide flippase family protein [bacterium]
MSAGTQYNIPISMTSKSSILRNIISNWGGFAVNIVIAMALSPFIVRTLGETVYGIWVLIGSLTGYLSILDLGVRTSLVKYISEYHAKRDFQALNEVFNTSLLAFLVIGALTIAVALVLPSLFALLVAEPPLAPEAIRRTIYIVGVNIALAFPLGLYGGLLSGFQRYDISSAIEIFIAIVKAVATVLLLKTGGGLVALAAISLLATIFASTLRMVAAHRLCPALALRMRMASRASLKKISNYSVFSFLVIIAGRIIFYTDTIVITTFMGVAAVAYFAVAANLIEYLRKLVKSMTTVFVPAISSYKATGQTEKLRQLLFHGTKYTLLITLWVGMIMTAYSREFFVLWMGPEFGERSAPVLVILLLPQILALGMYNFGSALYGLARHRALAFASMIEAAANLLLSIVLVKKLGLAGVALGTAIPQFINYVIWLPAYACRILEISCFEYLRRSVLPTLWAAIPLCASIVLMKSFLPASSWLGLAASTAACSTIYYACIWVFLLRRDLHLFAKPQPLGNLHRRAMS